MSRAVWIMHLLDEAIHGLCLSRVESEILLDCSRKSVRCHHLLPETFRTTSFYMCIAFWTSHNDDTLDKLASSHLILLARHDRQPVRTRNICRSLTCYRVERGAHVAA